MQELLLLTLLGALSPMPTHSTDQENVEQVKNQSTDAESSQAEGGAQEDNGQAEQGNNSPEEASESETGEGGQAEESEAGKILALNKFDFSGNEFNNTWEVTGTGSIFAPGIFGATEGEQVEQA